MRTLVFDTETTGLISNSMIPLARQPKIIEFAAILLNDGEEEAKENWLFNPGERLNDEVKGITSLKDSDLVNAPPFAQLAPDIATLIEYADEVVAHNLSFDQAMVDVEMKRANVGPINWPQLICTVEATEYLKGFRLKQMDLYEHLFGEKFEGAHRAATDVKALSRIFIELRKRGIV